MIRAVFASLLFFSALQIWPAQEKQITLVHDFTHNPSSQDLFEAAPLFANLKKTLEDNHVHIMASDLHEYGFSKKQSKLHKYLNKAKLLLSQNPSTTYFVFWNRPAYLSSSLLSSLPLKKKILFAWEPPSTQPYLYGKRSKKSFSKIYTWDDSLVDNKKYFKFFYPVLAPMQDALLSYEERELCTLIASNKTSSYPHELYSERRAVIEYFEKTQSHDFSFFGGGWQPSHYKNYRGVATDKIETLKKYRFAICYENMTEIQGYITEKIFDCFSAGCIPIYWGATNITEYIPKNCFIDRRDFASNEALYLFIKNLPKEEYNAYLQNIRLFLTSPAAQKFSHEAFIATFFEAIKD